MVLHHAELLSVAAFLEGKLALAFPGFGSERMVAPVMARGRIDDVGVQTRGQRASEPSTMTALEALIPAPRLIESDHVDLAAEPGQVWQVARHLDLVRSSMVRALFALRTAPSRGRSEHLSLRVDDLRSTTEHPGFQILDEQPPREFTVGAIGKVWHLDIPFVHVEDASDFERFAEPDYVKVAWAIRLETRGPHKTRLCLELRVGATDDVAWRKFRRYFVLVGPGSRFVRRSVLAGLAHDLRTTSSVGNDRPLGGWKKLEREAAASGMDVRPPAQWTTEAELAALPPAAQSMMEYFGVRAGQPKTGSVRLGYRGRFRTAPDKPWMPIEAIQFSRRDPVGRLFHMRATMNGVVPVIARDTYLAGHGRMLVRLADLITIADGHGVEYDKGELVTWLNDCVFVEPSMLLGPTTRWSHVDENTFDVSLTDGGRSVAARVFLNDRGMPINFETWDRFVNDPDTRKHPLVPCRWTTPVASWQRIDGRPCPARGRAVWHLASGDFTYAEFELVPEALAIEVLPFDVRTRPYRARGRD